MTFDERDDGAIIVSAESYLGVIEKQGDETVFTPIGKEICAHDLLIISLKMLNEEGLIKELYNSIEAEGRLILELNFA